MWRSGVHEGEGGSRAAGRPHPHHAPDDDHGTELKLALQAGVEDGDPGVGASPHLESHGWCWPPRQSRRCPIAQRTHNTTDAQHKDGRLGLGPAADRHVAPERVRHGAPSPLDAARRKLTPRAERVRPATPLADGCERPSGFLVPDPAAGRGIDIFDVEQSASASVTDSSAGAHGEPLRC